MTLINNKMFSSRYVMLFAKRNMYLDKSVQFIDNTFIHNSRILGRLREYRRTWYFLYDKQFFWNYRFRINKYSFLVFDKKTNELLINLYYDENTVKHIIDREEVLRRYHKLECEFCHSKDKVHYHHIHNKKENIYTLITDISVPLSEVLDEINKCVAVCPSCHQKIHRGELLCTLTC